MRECAVRIFAIGVETVGFVWTILHSIYPSAVSSTNSSSMNFRHTTRMMSSFFRFHPCAIRYVLGNNGPNVAEVSVAKERYNIDSGFGRDFDGWSLRLSDSVSRKRPVRRLKSAIRLCQFGQ